MKTEKNEDKITEETKSKLVISEFRQKKKNALL
jgi:hypothetical protein